MATPREIVARWDEIEGRQNVERRKGLLSGPPTGCILIDGQLTPVWLPDGPPPGVTVYVPMPGCGREDVSRETPGTSSHE